MYGLAGERRLSEWQVDWLPGYEGSRPVRIGNGAYQQFQLDVYGELLDAMYQSRRIGLEPEQAAWNVEVQLVKFLESAWKKPDEGIWEVRGPQRHFTHSKVMAWVAFDRAVKAVEKFDVEGPVDRWRDLRDAIHREVCAKGFDADKNSFVQYYGSKETGCQSVDDAAGRFLAGRRSAHGGHRGLHRARTAARRIRACATTRKPTSMACRRARERFCPAPSGWPTITCSRDASKEAEELFQRLLGLCNDVGLISEEYDPRTGRLVGNFPQAFTHVGLINTAMNLTRQANNPAKHRRE